MVDNYKIYFSNLIETNLPLVKELFECKLNHFVELEGLRNEILKCLMLEFYQPAIFSTNHFLERIIKLSLIKKHTINLTFSQPEQFNEKTLEAIEKYDNKKLSITLSLAKDENLITEDEYTDLNIFRDKIRNPYSHAEIKRIIVGAPEMFTGFMYKISEVADSIKKGEPIKNGTKTEIISLSSTFAQLYQQTFSKAIAFDYFNFVHEILIRIDKRINKLKTCT